MKLSATFFISVFVLLSCKKEETTIGDAIQGEGLDVEGVIDTFTIITYSEELDSMPSDERAVNLLGQYNDPVFGNVDCGIVSQFSLSSANPTFATNNTDVIVDSVVLGLSFTSINYYANLDDITIEVYEINDDLIKDEQEYYTFTTPNTIGSNLVLTGTETQKPDFITEQIVGEDTLSAHLRINLDPAIIGTKLIDINSAGNMSSDESFVSAFKGLYIKVDGSSLANGQGGVYYFDLKDSPLSKMTLYFHETSDPTTQKFDFDINNNSARYNKIAYDRTGTKVENLLNDKTLGQEEFYAQGGAIWSIIEIPYIMNLYQDSLGNNDPKIINKAELVLPVQDFTPDGFDPSTSLFIAKIVDARTSEYTLDYSFSSTISGNTVNYDEDTKEFRFQMTKEIQAILNGSRENTGFRVRTPGFFASTVERVIFNGPNSPLKNKARLEITYTDY